MQSQTILEQYLSHLARDMKMNETPLLGERHSVELVLDATTQVELEVGDWGFSLKSTLFPLPEEDREAACLLLMKGNFLGEQTGSSALSIHPESQEVVLVAQHPCDLSYVEFKEALENFVNYVGFWRYRWSERQLPKPGLPLRSS